MVEVKHGCFPFLIVWLIRVLADLEVLENQRLLGRRNTFGKQANSSSQFANPIVRTSGKTFELKLKVFQVIVAYTTFIKLCIVCFLYSL